MTPESENFEQLRRVMALKRHEVPPPGYFNNFSREVMSRIRAGKTAAPAHLSWMQRLWQALEVRPAYAGAFGLALCAFLVGGVIYSAKLDEQSGNSNFANNNSFATLPTSPATAFTGNSMGLTPRTDSLNGTPQSSDLFNQQIEVQPASFHPSGN
ncbi:MAG TPA: hypothetical protein VH255_08775 [Verrucomicrobiae bacterium]|nr:hypothetical protein [Verrucomicrobiae bacterium]